ncbi:DGQHR domain-containing protein [Mammaliicoccus sciuri]|uniref:DGQHR domain-containing protein n=1 Tax=Mammaliicoccus sciuri TaxID=1296 RepID=UPI001E62092C|nr:DGQHR domain-containing protein [Mammaliicoccus sciuri]MCD8882168.1 DGQHR domain-containing protein [Mammaliicoccus sciuri]
MLSLHDIFEIKQTNNNNYIAYFSKIKSKELIKYAQTIRLHESETAVQRFLDENRAENIAKYFEKEDAIFPTPIILSLNTDLMVDYNHKERTMIIENDENLLNDIDLPFSIIDGQHRVEGMKLFYERNHYSEKNIDIPIIIYLDADQVTSANIFVTINANQRPVDKSIIYELFGIMYNDSDIYTVQSFANQVVKLLNESELSPFKDSIRLLGRKVNGKEFISQGTIAKKIVERISTENNIIDDNLNLEKGIKLKPLKGKVFREYFKENRPDLVAKIIVNFFKAFSEVFNDIWNGENLITKKAIGFSGLMKLLDVIHEQENDLSYQHMNEIFHIMKKNNIDIESIFINKGSSESVANQIGKELIRIYKSLISH